MSKIKKKSFLAYPYMIWSAIFIVIPLILVIFFSFSKEVDDGYVFSLENYRVLMDPIYFKVFIRVTHLDHKEIKHLLV